jgi:hemolysin activation/secretion protein
MLRLGKRSRRIIGAQVLSAGLAAVALLCDDRPAGAAEEQAEQGLPPVDSADVAVEPAAPETAPAGDDGDEVGLPRLDLTDIGLPPLDPQDSAAPGQELRVRVDEFRFEGNTVFSDEDLAAVLDEYVGRDLSAEDLEEARRRLTQAYIDKGYINSGAVLPDQPAGTGVILFQIVEGRLSEINLQNNTTRRVPFLQPRLRDEYVKSRIRLGTRPPLNIVRLRDQLEVLRQNPNLRVIQAELRPGAEPGDAYLDVQIQEGFPIQLGLRFSNTRSPSVGAEQLELLASHRNLTGNGDVLSARYGVNTGGVEEWEFAGADDFSVDYTFPITPYDTTLTVSYEKTDSLVVEDPFQDLDITSDSDTIALTARQPVYRTVDTEAALFVSLDYRENETTLLGEPFSFSPGAEDGRTAVTAVRVGQEFNTRSQDMAFALRSTFSVGVDAFGATDNEGDIPEGQFLAWLGQLQYVRRLSRNDPYSAQLVARLSAQLAADPLLTIEQFSVGGLDTVRGYRENQIVRDNAVVGSLELQWPVFRENLPGFAVVPFFDVGYGWNVDDVDESIDIPESRTLYSVGVGLRYASPDGRLEAQVYYGYALTDEDNPNNDLQDSGLHFNVLLLAF